MGDGNKRVALVAHCILNQATVAHGLASFPGAVEPLVKLLLEKGYGLIQLPCPETAFLGMKRWWMSREQYDNPTFREHCRRILWPIVVTLKELTKEGVEYVLLGVRGSPSCGVRFTTSNPEWRGDPSGAGRRKGVEVEASGVFMEELLSEITKERIPLPRRMLDIDHKEVRERGLPRELVEEL